MAGGLRASGPKADIALIVADGEAVVGGAFTQNVMCAAPVTYCREVLAKKSTSKAVSLFRFPASFWIRPHFHEPVFYLLIIILKGSGSPNPQSIVFYSSFFFLTRACARVIFVFFFLNFFCFFIFPGFF
jgi:hypothetical protein